MLSPQGHPPPHGAPFICLSPPPASPTSPSPAFLLRCTCLFTETGACTLLLEHLACAPVQGDNTCRLTATGAMSPGPETACHSEQGRAACLTGDRREAADFLSYFPFMKPSGRVGPVWTGQ